MCNKELQEKWEKLFEQGEGSFDLGNMVVCDSCEQDYTKSKESGGMIFGSRAICPVCFPRWLENATRFHEENWIKARCKEGESFGDFVRRYRGPHAKVSMYKIRGSHV